MSGIPSDRVRVAIDEDGVAHVTLTRAEKHNALDVLMLEAIAAAAERLADATDVRAVVIAGEGESFCSGIDLARLGEGGGLAVVPGDGALGNRAQRAACGWAALPVPVIASIHGYCLGGGAQLAFGADIRIAAPDARIGLLETTWGLVPDMGLTHHLPRLVGLDVAQELVFTGRVVSGGEAAQLGVVTRTDPDPLAASIALAREIAARSPDAIRAAKRLLQDAWTRNDRRTMLAREATLQQRLLAGPNQRAAVAAGRSGSRAAFEEPSLSLD